MAAEITRFEIGFCQIFQSFLRKQATLRVVGLTFSSKMINEIESTRISYKKEDLQDVTIKLHYIARTTFDFDKRNQL